MNHAENKTTRLVIVDDHPIVRQAIEQMLASQADLRVVGQAGTLDEALAVMESEKPDLVLVDISLQDSSGLDLIEQAHAQWPQLPILVFTMHDETRYAQRALRAGARGFATKNESAGELLKAIRRVLKGDIYLSESLTPRMLARLLDPPAKQPDAPTDILTDRELEIYRMIGEGNDSRAIADRLNLSPKTVEVHRSNIKRKLGLKGAVELHQQAYEWVKNGAGQ